MLTVPCEEGLQAGEGSLAVLILHQGVVCLHALKPYADVEQVLAASDGDLIGAGEQIAGGGEVAAGVGAAVGDLRGAVERGASADDQSADGLRRR